MSGILAIVNVDGSPVDRALVEQLTASMAFRGPDGTHTWVAGPAGLGHAMLRTLPGPRQRIEPATIDGVQWITAHARLDDRRALRTALAACGVRTLDASTDSELILHAYRAWRDDCVLHLFGDFAFAIWDRSERRLFCARDHLGVRPFFYAKANGCVVVGNTLQTIRAHPAVPDTLDDEAVAEILLFAIPQDRSKTAFTAARRLRPAHSLVVADGVVRERRYWELTEPKEIRYRRSCDYIERFDEVLRLAVEDRLPPGRFSVMMSGGLDSTTLAAACARALRERGRSNDLRAHTFVFDRLLPDDERCYAQAAAEVIGIPIHIFAGDDHALFESWDDRRFHASEPVADPFAKEGAAFCGEAAGFGPVAFYGTGGDTLLSEVTTSHFRALAKRRRFGRLAAEMLGYVRHHRALPPVGLRTAIRNRVRPSQNPRCSSPPALPTWIQRSLVSEYGLEERWRRFWLPKPPGTDTLRPRAGSILSSSGWSMSMEGIDAASTTVPLEFRHPFVDLRVVNFLLAIPAVPWCVDKKLLRSATKHQLPDLVRLRSKSPARGSPLLAKLGRTDASWIDRIPIHPALERYVIPDAVPKVTGAAATATASFDIRPVCLNVWLHQQSLNRVHGANAHV